MLSKIGAKILEMVLTKLGSLLMSFITEWFESKKDEGDIRDAFENQDEGAVAGGLNDVFRR